MAVKNLTKKKKAKKTKHGVKTPETDLERIQTQYLGRFDLDLQVVQKFWIQKELMLIQLVCANPGKKDQFWFVSIRSKGGIVGPSIKQKFEDKKLAQKTFDLACEGKIRKRFQVIDSYYPSAKEFILSYDRSPESVQPFGDQHKLQFILALSELTEEGFTVQRRKPFEGKKKKKPEYFRDNKAKHRRVARALDNIEIRSKNNTINLSLLNGFRKMTEGGVKEGTLVSNCYTILRAYRTLSTYYPTIYNEFEFIRTITQSVLKAITEGEMKGDHNVDGNVERGEHHPMIPLDCVKEILDIAFDLSKPIFNYIILSLSIATRPSETKRLASHPKFYLIDGAFFNYKLGEMITKTRRGVDPKKLVNPSLSIVSRVILKCGHPIVPSEQGLTVDEFFAKDGPIRTKEHLAPYYERCLRTTAGHMIGFCVKAREPHKATVYDVKNRMGHKTIKKAIEVYAENLPHPSMLPEQYFGLGGIKQGEVVLSAHQPLWDAFLLKYWMDKQRTFQSKSNMKIIEKQIMTEVTEFQSINAPSDDIFEYDSL